MGSKRTPARALASNINFDDLKRCGFPWFSLPKRHSIGAVLGIGA